MSMKEENEKAGLKLNIPKTKIMASSPSLHGRQKDGDKVEMVTDFWSPKVFARQIFGLQTLCGW